MKKHLLLTLALILSTTVLTLHAQNWNEIINATASDAAASDTFGFSVAIDGDYAIVGAYFNDDDGTDSGSAYVFERTGSTWAEQTKLTASDATASDWFGSSVAISGDYAIVGAPRNDDNGTNSGSAYVFTRTGSTWTQQGKLTASDAALGDQFGFRVSISGDYAIIGASGNDDNGTDSGSAYVFARTGSTWIQQSKLTASDAASLDRFGNSVAISGDYAIVGAEFNDDNGSSSGSAYVFMRIGTTWTEQAKLTASDAAGGDTFGRVAIDGDTAIVGAYRSDDNGSESGSAYVYTRTGSIWTEQAKLTASDAAGGDRFGISVAIDGDNVIVGAYFNDDDGTDSGSAYVFARTGSTWSEQTKLIASDATASDWFGSSVAISGDYAIVGAYLNDDAGSDSGSAYFFEKVAITADLANLPDITAQCEATPTAPTANSGAITATADVTFPITTQGTTIVTWTYDDGVGNTLTQTQNVIITDTQAPTINFTNPSDTIIDSCSTEVIVPTPVTTDNCSVNTALDFDGQNDYVDLANYVIPTTGDFSVQLWAYNRSINGFKEFISQGSSGDAFYIGTTNNSGILRCGDKWTNTGINLPQNQWVHITFVKSNANAFLYLNGNLEAQTTNYSISSGGTNTLIGRQYGGLAEYPDATLDDLRIWNRALSESEITSSYDKILNGSEPNLIAYYNFEDGPGSSILSDKTVNSNNGTLINMDPVTDWVNSDAPITNVSLTNNFNGTSNASGTYSIGQTNITWTATDASGNQSTLTQTINAGDTENPNLSFIDSDDEIINSCSLDVVVPSPQVSDNCTASNDLALDFDGVDDQVDIPLSASLSNVTEFTIEGWFNQDVIDVRGGMFGQIISANQMIRARTWWDGYMYLYVYNGAVSYGRFDYSSVVNAGEWFHFALVFDGNNGNNDSRLRAYVNGQSVPLSYLGTIPSSTADLSASSFVIAENFNIATQGQHWSGAIDEFRIWDTARTATEILDNKDLTLSGNENNLIAYYDFEDGMGSSVLSDQSGNTFDGTLTNMDPATDWVDSTAIPSILLTNTFNGTADASGTYPVGQTVVTWTATDASGNQSTLNQTINAGDTEEPIITCGDAINLDFCQDATVEITAPLITDNCSDGLALNFDGSDDYLSIPRVQLLTGLTYQAWVKTSSTASSTVYDGNSALNIIGDRTNAIWNSFGISNGQLEYHHFTGSWQVITAPQIINDNQWYHVSVTHDETTNLVKLYINGIEVNSASIGYGAGGGTNAVGFDTIGASINLTPGDETDANEFFEGQLDEVRVWNRPLTETEILNNYNYLLNGNELGLVAYFNFENGSGNSIASDSSGDGNDAALTNMDINADWVNSGAFPHVIVTNNITGTADASGEYSAGQTDIIWTATDPNGNSTTCTQTVTIEDTTSPDIECAADISVGNDLGECSANIAVPQPIVSDNCTNDFALDFDGTDDFVDLNGSITLPNSFTIEAWVYSTSNTGQQNILSECDDPNTPSGCLGQDYDGLFFRSIDGRVDLSMFDNSGGFNGFVYASNTVLPLNTWTHVAATVNSVTKTVSIYYNGVLQSGGLTFNSGTGVTSSSYEPSIGGQNNVFNNVTTFPWSGKLDEIRIWDSQLSQTDIQDHFDDIALGNTPGLISYYDFEDGPDSTTLTDRTGSGVDGSLTNMDANTDWEQGPDIFSSVTLINDFNGTSDASGIYPLGVTEVVWTATDANNNSSNCSQLITVTSSSSECSITYTFNNDMWSPSDPSGIATANDDVVIVSGDATINANTTCNSVTVNPGAGLTVDAGATLTTVNGLTLESNSTSYSSLILDGTVTGTMSYERHVNINGSGTTGSNDLVSAPLTGQAFNTFAAANPNIFSNTAGDLFLFGPFDKTTGNYITYSDTETAILNAGVGYRAATSDNSTVTFTGIAENGLVTNNIVNSGPIRQEWNLVGNPYPSYLNVQGFLGHDVGGVTNIQLFDAPTAAIYGYDGNAQNGWTVYNLANTTASTLIAPGQGFFVSADATNSGAYDLEFTPAMRSTGNGDDFIQGRNAELIYLKLNLSSETNTYKTEFYFNTNASEGLDQGYDAQMFEGTNSEFSLYSHLLQDNEGKPIALQTLNSTNITNVSIPLGVNASQGEQITFSINESTLPNTVNVYLDDVLTNTTTLLNTSDYIITPATNASGTGRFFLRTSEDALSTIDYNLETLNIFALNSSKEVVVSGLLQESTNLELYDIQGRVVFTRALDVTALENRVDVSSLSSGVYVIRVNNNVQSKTQKVILK